MKGKNGVRSAANSRSVAEPSARNAIKADPCAPTTVKTEPRAQNTGSSGSFGLKEFIQGLAVGLLIGVLVTLIIR